MKSVRRLSKLLPQDEENLSSYVPPKTVVCPGILSNTLPKGGSINNVQLNQKFSKVSKSNRVFFVNNQSAVTTNELTLNPLQGGFEIRFKHLNLSSIGLRKIGKVFDRETPHLNLVWNFATFEKNTISLLHVKGPHYQIESSIIYRCKVNDSFFFFLSKETILIELYACISDKEKYLASGQFKLSEVLSSPTTNLYAYIDLTGSEKTDLGSEIEVVYGTLTLWYRFSCNHDILDLYTSYNTNSYEGLAIQKHSETTTTTKSSIISILKTPESRKLTKRTSFQIELLSGLDDDDSSSTTNSIEPLETEIRNFKDSLEAALTRDKALHRTQAEICEELKDRAGWLHEESNWMRTLQEYAILHSEDPNEVTWRQWRNDETANIELRNYSAMGIVEEYKHEFVINVVSVQLVEKSPTFNAEDLKKIFVEYKFLTDTEMKSSEALYASEIIFNFKRTFFLSARMDDLQMHMLIRRVKKAENLKFKVMGKLRSSNTAVEVAFCSINFLELIDWETNEVDKTFPLRDYGFDYLNVGSISINFHGILAMRKLVLRRLAPVGFDTM